MNEDRTTDTNSGNGSPAPPATFVETWATPDELEELDGLLKHFADLAEGLTDAPVGSEIADAMAAGMRAFQVLRGLNLRWRDEVNSGRKHLEWNNIREISLRYQRWSAASRRVLEQNHPARNSPVLAPNAVDATPLHAAFVQAMFPTNVNVDDLKASHERLEQYKSCESPASLGGGA